MARHSVSALCRLSRDCGSGVPLICDPPTPSRCASSDDGPFPGVPHLEREIKTIHLPPFGPG
jgi:hypothetical protein